MAAATENLRFMSSILPARQMANLERVRSPRILEIT